MKPGKAYSQYTISILKVMLGQLKRNDPAIASILRKELGNCYKEKRQQDLNKEIIRRLRIQNNKLQERRDSLKELLKQIKINRNQLLNRLENLRKMNRSLSDALGSCRVCWGEDLNCPHCRGNGVSGWRAVNKASFNKYVIAAIERARGNTK